MINNLNSRKDYIIMCPILLILKVNRCGKALKISSLMNMMPICLNFMHTFKKYNNKLIEKRDSLLKQGEIEIMQELKLKHSNKALEKLVRAQDKTE